MIKDAIRHAYSRVQHEHQTLKFDTSMQQKNEEIQYNEGANKQRKKVIKSGIWWEKNYKILQKTVNILADALRAKNWRKRNAQLTNKTGSGFQMNSSNILNFYLF